MPNKTLLLLLPLIVAQNPAPERAGQHRQQGQTRCDKASSRSGFLKGGSLKKCKAWEKLCIAEEAKKKKKDHKSLECYEFQAYLLCYVPFNYKRLCQRIQSFEGKHNCTTTFEQNISECKSIVESPTGTINNFGPCDTLKELKKDLVKLPAPVRDHSNKGKNKEKRADVHRCDALVESGHREACRVAFAMMLNDRSRCKNGDRNACKAAKKAKEKLPEKIPGPLADVDKDERERRRDERRNNKQGNKTNSKTPSKLQSKPTKNKHSKQKKPSKESQVSSYINTQFGNPDQSKAADQANNNPYCQHYTNLNQYNNCVEDYTNLKKLKNQCKSYGKQSQACLDHADLKAKIASDHISGTGARSQRIEMNSSHSFGNENWLVAKQQREAEMDKIIEADFVTCNELHEESLKLACETVHNMLKKLKNQCKNFNKNCEDHAALRESISKRTHS